MMRKLFWLLVTVTVTLYLVMVIWSLPYIAAQAGGLAPFDMRPTGYTFDEARAFLVALSEEGKVFYQNVQHRLDLFFPGLIAATLFFAISSLLPKRLGHWRYTVTAPVVFVAIFDWMENRLVGQMLVARADGLTADMAAAANWSSIAKATASTVAYSVLLILLIWKGVARWRRRAAA